MLYVSYAYKEEQKILFYKSEFLDFAHFLYTIRKIFSFIYA